MDKKLAAQRSETAVWLSAGALTLGIGAATLIGGTAVAHADADAGSSKASVASSAPHSGPKAAKAAKAPGHRAPAKASNTVRLSAKRPVVAPAKAATTPLQSAVDGAVRTLVALGGMNQTTPTPARGNLWQLGLYSVARWLADTANPGGIPRMTTVVTGQPNALTGVVTGQVVFATAAGSPVTYQISVDPKLGTVVVDPDGSYTFTPLQSTVLGAPDGGMVVKMKVTAINGVQRASQTVSVSVGNPWALAKQTVAVGNGPFSFAVSPDGTRLVVTNYVAGTVSLVDTATNKVIATIPVGSKPAGVVFDPTGTRFYVVNSGGVVGSVSAVSLPGNTVAAPIVIATGPFFAAIGPAGSPSAGKLYVTIYGAVADGNTVSVIDTTTNQVTAVSVAAAGAGPQAVAISPDGTRLWVSTAGSGNVSVINTATNAVVKTIPVSGAAGIAFSPDGHFAYVANFTANTVSVINTANYTTAATIPVGASPSSVAVSPDGSVAYVTNQQDNTVSVINTATKTVIKTITVGSTAAGLAVSPDGTHLYVANPFDASITVIPV
ncbi:YncE family protein [Mycobacterium sp. RTGN5]|uniref:YncE family protein n=1 Tax=Mycobacterium sp. RTGN5 TaxID=3016522 RepID=UPI0029C8C748|nr:beta-propeller fold lactonase family protein [Mycobacterium sp. RTGN5]